MSRRLYFQVIELALTLSLVCGGQVHEKSETLHMAKSMQSLPQISPLLESIFPHLKPEEPVTSPLPSEAPFMKRPQFIKLLVERLEKLEEQKTYDNESIPIPDHLSLILQDGTSNTVSIEFTPNTETPDQSAAWSSIVNLLADTLAQVIQKAEQLGYNAYFKYSISLETPLLVSLGRGLSANALKSAVG